MGPDAFADPVKFPSGKSCDVGDWVVTRRYAGDKWITDGVNFKIIADTEIVALIDDPEEINALTLKTRK